MSELPRTGTLSILGVRCLVRGHLGSAGKMSRHLLYLLVPNRAAAAAAGIDFSAASLLLTNLERFVASISIKTATTHLLTMLIYCPPYAPNSLPFDLVILLLYLTPSASHITFWPPVSHY